MNNRPNPKEYKNPSISPTKMLNETFVITSTSHVSYEGVPQLLCTIIKQNSVETLDLYVSNRVVMAFLEDIANTEFSADPLYFYKSDDTQKHYEIAWATVDENHNP